MQTGKQGLALQGLWSVLVLCPTCQALNADVLCSNVDRTSDHISILLILLCTLKVPSWMFHFLQDYL